MDRKTIQPGTNTLPIGTYEIEDVQPWNDFTLEKILDCFGDILLCDVPTEDLYNPPPIRKQHLKLTDESSVDSILKKHNHTIVDRALELVEPRLEGRGLRLPISMSWGSESHLQEDSRLRPDWAGTIGSGRAPYENRVPGDTKQSAKWRSTMKNLRWRVFKTNTGNRCGSNSFTASVPTQDMDISSQILRHCSSGGQNHMNHLNHFR